MLDFKKFISINRIIIYIASSSCLAIFNIDLLLSIRQLKFDPCVSVKPCVPRPGIFDCDYLISLIDSMLD